MVERVEDRPGRASIPERFRKLFWDLDLASLDLKTHRRQVVRRVLRAGDWEAIEWLRGEVGDEGLRAWFSETRGRGLDPRRLRFWELVLDLKHDEVTGWIEAMRHDPWHRRSGT
jgi:hypothetical protein